MTGATRTPSSRPVVVLFALSVVALLVAGTLTVVAVAESEPEPAGAGPVAATENLPSPSATPPAQRATGLPQCVVGSWRTVDELMMVKFYTDVGELPMTTSGRYYEFHPDGTGVERNKNVELVGTHRGNQIRMVGNGTREFTWTATDTTITYETVTRSSLAWSYYDQRGFLSTQPVKADPNYQQTYDYTCDGRQLLETDASGYRSKWTRTADYGYYR